MPQKVTWRKGMRLTTDAFHRLDRTIEEYATLSALCGTGGDYGLLRGPKPFGININVSNNLLEVSGLCCQGITASGQIVDIEFDSDYSSSFDTRIAMPPGSGDDSYILAVRMHAGERREVSDNISECLYEFELIGSNMAVPTDSLPLALLVNDYGWRINETDYVPPCLYLGAHRKYEEALERARGEMRRIADRCASGSDCVARGLLGLIWSASSSECITLSNGGIRLSPRSLLASIQRVISEFTVGCAVDEYISLEDPSPFVSFISGVYEGKHLYPAILEGIRLLSEIAVKMESVCLMSALPAEPTPRREERPAQRPKPIPAPEPPQQGRNRWAGIEI